MEKHAPLVSALCL